MANSVLSTRFYGFNVRYDAAMDLMHAIHQDVAAHKRSNHLMLLEHEPVITITRQHMYKSLIKSPEEIIRDNIKLSLTDRGGDATFHGPGQLVGYPIIKLRTIETNTFDLSWLVRSLERGLLLGLQSFGIDAEILKGYTGIWIKNDDNSGPSYQKLAAIGLGVKNGASKHGFALNVTIDHAHYCRYLVPCGLKDFGITSLEEVFLKRHLPIPNYSAIVFTLSSFVANELSMELDFSDSSFEGDRYQTF